MIKLQITYKTESEKLRMIEILSSASTVKKISKTYKNGQFYKVYLDIE